jgi:hypothetical protein
MNANLLAEVPQRPLKAIVKVRLDSTLVRVWIVEATATALVIEWRTRSAGLGSLRFERRDGQVACDSEGRSRSFVRDVLLKTIEGSSSEQWPSLVRLYGGVTGLVEAVTPRMWTAWSPDPDDYCLKQGRRNSRATWPRRFHTADGAMQAADRAWPPKVVIEITCG